jgi:winged helix DNA-binding protein
VGERVLTLRELNRATLVRQLLLERKRLSPTAVIERLVGMQAQWPSAPYVGIWTRTTSFRREALERELASAAVVKATVMRQTLHLVTRRDYALLRAALSETNFPDQTSTAKRLAPSVRALAAAGPVTTEEALAHLEREQGLTGIDARRAWLTDHLSAHVSPRAAACQDAAVEIVRVDFPASTAMRRADLSVRRRAARRP